MLCGAVAGDYAAGDNDIRPACGNPAANGTRRVAGYDAVLDGDGVVGSDSDSATVVRGGIMADDTVLNGQVMQQANTSDMIFPVAELISYLSTGATLLPGSVILTGTPSGVGFTRKPPVFLMPGDTVEITVEGIGTLSNPVELQK